LNLFPDGTRMLPQILFALPKSVLIERLDLGFPFWEGTIKDFKIVLRDDTNDTRLSSNHVACRLLFVIVLVIWQVGSEMASNLDNAYDILVCVFGRFDAVE
jgi:hypothetical protein